MRGVRDGKVGSLVVSLPERGLEGSEGRGLVGGEKGRCLGSGIGGLSEEKLVAEVEVRELGFKDGVLEGFGDGEKVGSLVSGNVGLLVDKSDVEVEAKELEMEDGGAISGLEGCDLVVDEKVSSLVSGDVVLLVGKSDAEVEARELGTESGGAICLVLDEKVNTLISGSMGLLEDKSVVEVEARELGSGGSEATHEHHGCDDACGSVEVGTSGDDTFAADDRMSSLITDNVVLLGSESCDAGCKVVKEVDCLLSNDGSESVAIGTSRGCNPAVLELVSPLPGDNVAPLDDKCAAGEKVEELPVLCNSADGEIVKEVDMLLSDVHASRIYENGSVEQGSTLEGHRLTIGTVSPLPGDILSSSDDKLSVEVTASELGIEFAKADKEIVEEKVECLLPNAAELAAESNNTDGEVAKEISVVGFSRLIDGYASIVLNPLRGVRLMVDETTVPSPNETVVSLSIKSSVIFKVREFTSDCNKGDGDTVTEVDCMVSDVGPSQLLDKSECLELCTSRDDSLAIVTVGPSQSENVALLNIENGKVAPVLESNGTDEGLENGNMKMSQEGDISSVLDEQDATVHCGHDDERDTVLDVREEFHASSCETGRVISLSAEKKCAPEPSLTNASVSSVHILRLISDNSKATEIASRDSQGPADLGRVAIPGDQSTRDSKVFQEPNPVVFSRRSNPKRASSLRKASTVAETQQITRICKVERSKKAAGKKISSSRSLTWVFSNNITRKRGPRKRGNASAWGMVLNVSEMFSLSDMASNSNNEIDLSVLNSKIQKCSSGRQASKAKKARRGKGVKSATSTKSLDLTEQITSQTLAAISDPLSASAVPDNLVLSFGNQMSNICSGGQVSISDGCLNTQLLHPDSHIDSPIPSTEKDFQHGEKDPESSITQETSFENNPGNFAGISSQVGSGLPVEIGDDKLLSYPSTSPESDIVHPTADVVNLMSDFITVASPKPSVDVETTCENFSPDSSPKDNFHLGISSLANASTSFSLKTESLSLRREDKNIEVQQTLSGLPELLSPGKGANMLGQQSEIEKPTKLCESAWRKQASSARKSHNRNSRRKPCKKGSNSLELLTGPSPETMNLTCSVGTADVKTGELAPVSSEQDFQKTLSPEISKAEGSRQRPVAKKHNNGKHKKEKIINKKKAENTEILKHCAVEQEGQTKNACVTGNGLLAHDSGIGNTPSPTSTIDSTGGTTMNRDNGITPGSQLESGVAFHSDKSVLENPHLFSENQYLPPRIAWVCCDDCSKWRCIPAELADQINETNCKWNCKDNSDKAFADCSIPQEKTNAEINAELEISEGSCEEDSHVPQTKSISPDHAKLSANQQSSWKRLKSNLFLHRNRKTQTIDEIMVCHCKPPTDGSLGCRDECLNRMLNIECGRGTCPCGDLCSNQQFQKRKYAKLKWYRCGKKGYGLQLQENISEGHFLIEYVGEVLEMTAYEARQREYASRGQKHFYFMTLNNSEVIDACTKGNLGRFINHSCDPNCRTEKWMVNGEVCIGLFALRNIKKGEEVTFDYNYVRVVGAAVKKCMCGAAACRGYIGGDPSNSEVIVQSDSDEEYTEPVMVRKDSGSQQFIDKPVLDTVSITRIQAHSSLDTDKSLQERIGVTSIPVKNDCQQRIDLANDSSVNPVPEISLETKNNNSTSSRVVKISPSDASSEELNSTSIPRPAAAIDDLIVTNDKDGNAVNTRKITPKKLPRSSAQVEKNRTHVDQGRKCVAQKTKKIAAASCNGHFDEVKEKLNELIGADGGISKSKDGATKGYLKLLVVTAADNAENSRSTRDLSLILDALLMTKSRTILMDIVTKNGLQMLHNIMKKNQKDNNKIPVLRKLLKVLLFLAEKKILDKQHLNMNPSCAGAESFHDSLIKLIQHKDIKVHDAARGFLNMLGCHATKPKFMERSNGSLNFRRNYQRLSSTKYDHHIVSSNDAFSHDNHTIYRRSMLTGTCSTSDACKASENYSNISSVQDESIYELIPQKRRSRWDQDRPLKKIKSGQKSSSLTESRTLNTSEGCAVRRSYSQHHERNHSVESRLEVCSGAAVASNIPEFHTVGEAPPGFGSLSRDANNDRSRHANVVTPGVGCDVALAKRQERYLSHLPISHGIPLVVMQQFGTPTCAEENRGDNFLQNWAVAPGTTFHPYPPLPSHPRKKAKRDVQSSYSLNHQTTTSNSMDKSHRTEQFTSDQSPSSTSMPGTQVGAIYVGKAGSSRQSLHGSGSGSSNPHPNMKNGGDVSWRPWPREK